MHAVNKEHSIYYTVSISLSSSCKALTLIDTSAAVSVVTHKLASALAWPVCKSHFQFLVGVGSVPVLGMIDIKIPLNSYEFATADITVRSP